MKGKGECTEIPLILEPGQSDNNRETKVEKTVGGLSLPLSLPPSLPPSFRPSLSPLLFSLSFLEATSERQRHIQDDNYK